MRSARRSNFPKDKAVELFILVLSQNRIFMAVSFSGSRF